MRMLAVQDALESRRNTVRRNGRTGTGILVRQSQEIVALLGVQTKGFGQRIEDVIGDPDVPGLLQPGIPAGAYACQVGNVFPSQSRRSP